MKRPNNEGFTLVELLISLALLSLMAIYAVQAFSALHNLNRVEEGIAAQMEVDALARHLRTEISDARAVFVQDGTPNSKLVFDGQPHTLTFVTASNGERETGGLYQIEISLDESGTLKSKRRLIGQRPSEHIDEIMLLRDLKDITFGYAKVGTSDELSSQWQIKNQLPDVITIGLEFEEKDIRTWQTQIVRLQTVD
jgi:general secretion pathway protein J